MFLNGYPYTDFHEMNLDFILKAVKTLEQAFKDFTASNSLIFAEPLLHDITKSYAKNTIVLDSDGNAYISLQAVPAGVQLSNNEYWLMVFNFEEYTEKANKNFTVNYFRDTTRSDRVLAVGDWLVLDDVLYKVTAAIAVDDLFEVGVNIEHFTVEQFLKDFTTSIVQTVNQYKNDIDASEAAYHQAMQDEVNRILAGATVDSEVIDARLGWNGTNYTTLGQAIRTQITNIHDFTLSRQADKSGANDDFNDYEVGWCRVYSLTNPTHSPVADPFGIVFTTIDSPYPNIETRTQLFFSYRTNDSYIRFANSGNWQPWYKLSSAANADTAYDNMLPRHNNLTGSGIDFNDLTVGFYRIYNTSSPSNAPISDPFGLLAVIKDDSSTDNVTQIFFSYRGKDSFIRFSVNNGLTWDNWATFYRESFVYQHDLTGSGIDFDTLDCGWYRVYGTTSPSHSPVSNPFGFLQVYTDAYDLSNSKKTEILFMYRTGQIFIRFYAGSSWDDWHEIKSEYAETIHIYEGDHLYSIIRNAPANSHIIIHGGTYDISSDLESAPDTNYNYDMHIKSGMWVEGLGLPKIICHLTTKRIYNSPFFFDGGDGKLSGVELDCVNTRYCVHDDKANNIEGVAFQHVIEGCVFSYSGVAGDSASNGRAIGGGMGSYTKSIVQNNIFVSDTNAHPVDYHTNSNAESSTPIIGPGCVEIINNYFTTGSARCRGLDSDLVANRDRAVMTNNHGTTAFVVTGSNNTIIPYIWNNDV